MNISHKLLVVLSLFTFALTSCGEKSISLSGAKNNTIVDTMEDIERNYINAMEDQARNIPSELTYKVNDLGGDTVKINDYVSRYTEGKGKKLTLSIDTSGFNKNTEYQYHLSTKEDFSDEFVFTSKSNEFTVHSLKVDTKYYWKVTCGEISSSVQSFITEGGFREIDAGATNNVRDMGGHIVKGNKRIKQGLIYRGCELNTMAYDDLNGTHHYQTINDDTLYVFNNIMKVGTEIDFRGDKEVNITSSNLGSRVTYDRLAIGGYGSLVTSRSEDSKVNAIFKHFLNARRDSSVYFHCMGGADRTGTIAFLLGGLLGMSYSDLVIDFELTSYSYNLRQHDVVATYSNFPSLIEGLKTVSGNTEENPDIQSMIENYLVNYVGLTNEEIQSIKTIMLEDID